MSIIVNDPLASHTTRIKQERTSVDRIVNTARTLIRQVHVVGWFVLVEVSKSSKAKVGDLHNVILADQDVGRA